MPASACYVHLVSQSQSCDVRVYTSLLHACCCLFVFAVSFGGLVVFQLSQLRAQASKLGAQLANMREETRDKLGIAVRDAMPGLSFKLASLVPPLPGSRWTCESPEVNGIKIMAL